MDAIECLMTRRSVRKFMRDPQDPKEAKPVNDEMIDIMLKAAGNAPSGGNQQPWQFVVIKDKTVLKDAAGVHSNSGFAANAACAVLICHDTAVKLKHEGLVLDDCSAAMENLLLSAHALGLGACWIGIHHLGDYSKYLRNVISAPDSVQIISMAAIGWPERTAESSIRLKPEMVHINKW